MENGNKKSLISSIIFCAVLFLQSGCTSEIEIENISNGKSEVHDVRPPFTIRATVSSFTGLEVTDKSSTPNPSSRAGEEGYTTVFNPGDAIGIFALRNFETPNVATIDGVYNLKLVYTKAADGTVSWAPAAGDTRVLYSYDDDLTYVAYYPYREGITIKQDLTYKIFEDLANNAKLQPAADQSTPAAYTGSDLMAAVAKPTVDPANANKKVLTLEFEHLHALLVLKPRGLINYLAPAGAGFEYSDKVWGVDVTAKDVVINSTKALPMSDGTFRAILKAGVSASTVLTGSYKTKNDKVVLYTNTLAAGVFTAGKCYTQQVEASVLTGDPINRELQVGDYFCSNGKIFPADSPVGSEDIIGIVFHVGPGPGDAISNYADTNISEDIHGYVMALTDAYPSDTDKKWGRRQVYFGTGQTTQFDGYTKKYAEQTNGLCQAAAEIRNFRTAVPVPSTASNWYMPSYAQLQTIWNAYKHSEGSVIYRSLQKVGGDLFAGLQYWTVTETSLHDVWVINMQTGATASNIGKCSGNDMGWGYDAYSGIHLTRVVLTF